MFPVMVPSEKYTFIGCLRGVFFCLFLPGIDLGSKKQLYSVISVQHSFHHLEMKRDGQEFFYQSILFPAHPPLSMHYDSLKTIHSSSASHPPRHTQTLTRFHHKYSTHCLNHPLSLHEQEPVPGPGHRKPITHPHFIPLQPTEISLGLHTITYLPS